MKNIDRIISIAFFIIASVFFMYTYELPEHSQGYPRLMLGIMTLLAFMLFIKSFIHSSDLSWKELFGYIDWKRFFYVLLMSGLYVFFMNAIGFFTTTAIYLIVMMFLLKASKILMCVSIPTFIFVLFLIFKVALKVPLPTGVFI